LISKEKGEKQDPLEAIKKLKGIAKGAIPENIDYKDAIADYLMDKYK